MNMAKSSTYTDIVVEPVKNVGIAHIPYNFVVFEVKKQKGVMVHEPCGYYGELSGAIIGLRDRLLEKKLTKTSDPIKQLNSIQETVQEIHDIIRNLGVKNDVDRSSD